MQQPKTLSQILTDTLNEAKRLLELKAEFGRLPNGKVREQAIAEISLWFDDYELSKAIEAEEILIYSNQVGQRAPKGLLCRDKTDYYGPKF